MSRAAHAGLSIGLVCNEIKRNEGVRAERLIYGVLSLAKRHGQVATNAACEVAIHMGMPNYRFVRTYIEKHPAPTITLRQIDPLIRQLTQYRTFIENITKEHQ